VALRPPRLDEVFLALTGQAPEEEPANNQVAPAGKARSVSAGHEQEEVRHG
jgi:hypothetical protein